MSDVFVRSIRAGESIGARRGEAVVCVLTLPGQLAPEPTLRSVAQHTADRVPVVVCDSATAVAGAIDAAAPADVVLIRAGVLVPDGWLAALSEAAYDDATVATATPLSSGEIPAAARASAPPPPADRAGAVRAASLKLRPRLTAAHGPCVYVRRSAIELVGGPLGSEAGVWPSPELSRACLQAGLTHVLADDLLVDHPGQRAELAHGIGPVARALSAARLAVGGLTVVVDARILSGPLNGTRVHVLELLAALSRSGRASVTAIVPAELDELTRRALSGLSGLGLATPLPGSGRLALGRADIVHRPFQISSPAELTTLGSIADRVVISHQDLISYRNPSYFRSEEEWHGYRDMTRRGLALADGVAFFTRHVRDEAVAEELVEPHRAYVIPLGVDHAIRDLGVVPAPPRGYGALIPEGELILCLGANFRHKNRIFALRVLRALQRRHSWPGQLVLAGPLEADGSSWEDERAILAEDPALARAVVDLGPVSEAEKQWLLTRAGLVLYPTVHEGFGLIPFEAADHGVPCLWAAGTALAELLPAEAAGIVPWDADAAAERALALIRDTGVRWETVGAVREAAKALRWATTADQLLDLYEAVCREPASPAAVLERASGTMRQGISEDAMRLVGPDGVLSDELERPLLALATHPRIGAPVLGAIKAGYRAYRRLRPTERP